MSALAPYTVEPRADTKLTNPRLGLYLFLASEVLFFGSLFAAYVFLRFGSPSWPRGSDRLEVWRGGLNTLVLLLSSVVIVWAVRQARRAEWDRFRVTALAAVGLGSLFVISKLFEYRHEITAGYVPASDVFFAVYYTLTGVHLVHLIAGIAVVVWLAGPGQVLRRGNEPERSRQLLQRCELAAVYWHFVDVVWLILFPSLYLS